MLSDKYFSLLYIKSAMETYEKSHAPDPNIILNSLSAC